MSWLRVFLSPLLVLGSLLAPGTLGAQTPSLTGRVADATGRAIVGAVVTITAGGTSVSVTTTTDGSFLIAAPAPAGAVLSLTVTAPGFASDTRTLQATSTGPIEVVLAVAALTESVRVAASTPLGLTTAGSTASRLELSPLMTPASVATIPGELIRSLGTPTLVVAKSLAPGLTSSAPMGNGGNVITARGFSGANSVKQLYNGLEIYNAGNVVSFPFDPWNVEHVGALYGPASVLYGAGAIGGAVNVVSRRPDPSGHRREAAVQAGRFGTWHAAVGATGPISRRLSYRLDASQRRTHHWVERGEADSLAVSGSLRFDATNTLRLTVANDFGNQNPSVYLGTPVVNNAPVDALRKKNYNVADADLTFTDNWTTVDAEWRPSPTLTVRAVGYFLYHDRVYRDVFTFAYLPATNQVRRTQFRHIDDTWQTQTGSTGHLRWSTQIAGLPITLLAGYDGNHVYYHRNDNVRGGTSLVDAITFDPGEYLDFYSRETEPFYRLRVRQAAAFSEARVELTDRLSVVAGLRSDHYRVRRFDNRTLDTTRSTHRATGWSTGVVQRIGGSLSVYGQYAAGADPVASFASISPAQQLFSLSPGRQVEAGVKQVTLGDRLEWTLAGYHIVKRDLLTASVTNPSLTEQVGQQSSRGVEAAVAVSAGPLRIQINGTMLDARFDDFRASVSGQSVSLTGNVPVNVPERSTNVLLAWQATPAVRVQGVFRVVGQRFADNTNAPLSRIPAYQVADFGVHVRASARLGIDIRLDNAFDVVYADSGSASAWLLGAPRALSVGARVAF